MPKLFRGVSILVLSSLFLVACQSTSPSPTSQETTGRQSPRSVVATVALPGVMVESMNPYAHSTTQIYPTWKHVLEPLVEWDWTKKEIVPILAESWSNPDRNTWVFKLKQGVTFHDGSPFTADDAIHSFTRIKSDPDSKQASSLAEVDAMQALDPHTVKIHTDKPDAALLFRLAQRFITSKSVYDKLGQEEADRRAIGTGPYKFKEWVQGQRFVLEKNADYRHSSHVPTVDEVVFRNIPEAEAAITSLLNGEVDIIANVPPESVSRLTGQVRPVSTRTINIIFLGMHAAVPQFQNKLVRQAVNYAINREAITDDVLKGRGYPLDAPIGPDQYGYSSEIQPKYTYDPEKAKQLLAEAGYPDGFDVDFLVPVGQYTKVKEIAEAIASMLQQVGIRTNLMTQDQATGFAAIREGQAPMYIFGRGSVIDPSEYLQQYFHTGVTKRLSYSKPDVDAALEAQQAAFDPEERLQLLRNAMSLLMEEAPVAWLFQYQGTLGVSNRFEYAANPGEDVYAWDLKPR